MNRLLKAAVLSVVPALISCSHIEQFIGGRREEVKAAASENVCHDNSALATEIAKRRLIEKHPKIKRSEIKASISGRCAMAYVEDLPQ